jgi:PAS domain S-box-containing protein
MQQQDNRQQISPQSAELFHLIVENIKEYAIFMTDLEGRVISWNPGVERLLGYKESEIVGQHASIIFTEEDLARGEHLMEMETAAQTGCAEDKRWHVRRDGSRFWASGILTALKNEAGALRGFAKVMRDESAQKEHEEALLKSEERYRTLFNSIDQGFCILEMLFDENGKAIDYRFLEVNPVFEKMTGIPNSEALSEKTARQLIPNLEDKWVEIYAKVALTGESIRFEERSPAMNRWFDVYGFRFGEEESRKVALIFNNISERKQTENALRESREMLNLAMSSSRMGAWSRDIVRDEVEWSPQLEEIFGLSAGTFSGTINGFYDYVYPPDRERVKREIWDALNDHSDYTIEFRFLHTDGSLRWMEGRGQAVYGADGTPAKVYGIGIDITERKQAEEKLRLSEERFRSLVDQSVGGITQADLTGRFIMVNDYYCQLVGYSREELLEMRMQDISHPEDLTNNSELFTRLITDGVPFEIEKRYIRSDGSIIWVHNSVSILRDANGKPQNTVAVTIDITERKQIEEKLRKSEARLRLAIDISQIATFEIDLLTDAVETDEIGREIYGFEKDQSLTFRLVQSRFHPEDSDEVLRSVSAALTPNGSGEFEVEQRIIRTNGEMRWIRVRGRAFFEGEGESKYAVRCLGTYIDITERKQTEQEREQLLKQLEIERSRLAYLFTKAPAFVATVSGPDHVFELTNPAYLQLIGHRDVIGKPVREALPEVKGQGFFEILDEVFKTGEPFIGKELSINLQRQPGGVLEERFVDFVYQPIFGEDDSSAGIFAHGIDITEQVQARREAERANRLKDEFLATLSHELRTPLNAILGWSHILQNRSLGESEREKAIATIERNARSQSQLIDDILDVSRIITGKLRLDVRAVDLAGVIMAALDAVRPAAEAKNIRLQTLIDPQAGPISGDSDRLQQVVWNLLSNAIKFTPKDGRVQIRLERVNSHIEVIVSDTGKGIEPEFLPFVFDRFRQSDGSTTRRQGGLGLGLAIVRQLVELHGGSVSVSSAGEGQGATFTVNLPLLPLRAEPENNLPRVHPTAAQNDSTSDCPSELSGLRVLLVDDEADSRDLLSFVLDSCGASVKTANSAAEALELIKSERFDVIISDIGMPEEDGYSLIGKIRGLPAEQGGNVPAIALTAYARSEDRVHALRSGFQMHIAKPVEGLELITVMANLAGRITRIDQGENE